MGTERKDSQMIAEEKKKLITHISRILVSEEQITPQEQMRMLKLLQERR